MTKLIEFKNHQGEILRGLIDEAKSNLGVIFVHGFERTTIENKFKNIIDRLKGKVNLFRFDFSGCGLSDGKFEDITVRKLSKELEQAIFVFKKHCPRINPVRSKLPKATAVPPVAERTSNGVKKIVLLSHSFGCCVALKFIVEKKGIINKIIFLAPAFNQRKLFKYWFMVSKNEEKNITWYNFKQHFSEIDFEQEMRKSKRMTKAHFISNKYFLENRQADYQDLFRGLSFDFKNILVVHGDEDEKVPIESNNNLPKDIKLIKVKRGDHDLERMDMVKQYLNRVIAFILR